MLDSWVLAANVGREALEVDLEREDVDQMFRRRHRLPISKVTALFMTRIWWSRCASIPDDDACGIAR